MCGALGLFMLALQDDDQAEQAQVEVDLGAMSWWLDFAVPMRALSAVVFKYGDDDEKKKKKKKKKKTVEGEELDQLEQIDEKDQIGELEQTEEKDQIGELELIGEKHQIGEQEVPEELPLPANIKGIPAAIRKVNGDDGSKKKKKEMKKDEKKKKEAKKVHEEASCKGEAHTGQGGGSNHTPNFTQTKLSLFEILL